MALLIFVATLLHVCHHVTSRRWPIFSHKQKLLSLWLCWHMKVMKNKLHVRKADYHILSLMRVNLHWCWHIFVILWRSLVEHLIDNRCWSLFFGLLTLTAGSANSYKQKACWSCIFFFSCIILWSQPVNSCQMILYAICWASINRALFDLYWSIFLS